MCGLGVTCENFQWGWLGLYIGIDIDEDANGPNIKLANDIEFYPVGISYNI